MKHNRRKCANSLRQEELVSIAERLCSELGAESVKLREIARRAKIAAPSIYNHFPSLDDLLAAVVARHAAKMEKTYHKVSGHSPTKAMEEVCRSHVKLFAAHPGAARLILADFHTPNGVAAVEKMEANIDVVNELDHKLIRRGQNQGVFRNNIKPHDVTIARIGMSLTLLSDRWFDTANLNTREVAKLGSMVADFTLRILCK